MDQFSVDAAQAKQRLDLFVLTHYPESTRARIQQWIEADRVQVNGAPSKSSYRLREGDAVAVEPAAAPPLHAEPEAIPLVLLYEDADVVAIDKPAGMVVHAGAGVTSGTLVRRRNALESFIASIASPQA